MSNVPYNVSAFSVNNFELVNGPESHSYTLTYAGNTVTQGADIFATNQTATTGQNREIRITYVAATVPFGTYGDDITFTIEQQ